MFGGKENFRILSNIDKKADITADRLERLTEEVKDSKITDDAWQGRVEAAIQVCPEAAHIKTQNGKIDDMTITLKAVKLLTKIIIILGIVIGGILGIMQYASSNETVTYMESNEDQAKTMEIILGKLNTNPTAIKYNLIFTCNNKNINKPSLAIIMEGRCLKCDNCDYIIELLQADFGAIFMGWHRTFGSEYMYIYNEDHNLIYTIKIENNKLKLEKHTWQDFHLKVL